MYWNYLVPLIAMFMVVRYRYPLPNAALPLLPRIKMMLGGMAVAAGLCLLVNSSLALYHDIGLYQRSIEGPFFPTLLATTSSVVIEELFFRGVLFLLLLAFFPAWCAIFISSLAFGVFHWFSYGVFGNLAAMLAVAITTGSFGAVMCYAYLRSNTLLVPFAIHAGWNLSNALVIDISGQQLALLSTPQPVPKDWAGFFAFSAVVIVLLLFIRLTVYGSRTQAS